MKTAKAPFTVHIPNPEGTAVAETIEIEIDVTIEDGTEILCPKSLAKIERVKFQRMTELYKMHATHSARRANILKHLLVNPALLEDKFYRDQIQEEIA